MENPIKPNTDAPPPALPPHRKTDYHLRFMAPCTPTEANQIHLKSPPQDGDASPTRQTPQTPTHQTPQPPTDESPSTGFVDPVAQTTCINQDVEPTISHAVARKLDDDGGSGSESEESVDSPERGIFGQEYPARYFFRAPRSSEPCSVKFTNEIQPAIKELLAGTYDEYCIFLVVSVRKLADDVLEIPYVFVGFETKIPGPLPEVEEIVGMLGDDIGFVFCRVQVS